MNRENGAVGPSSPVATVRGCEARVPHHRQMPGRRVVKPPCTVGVVDSQPPPARGIRAHGRPWRSSRGRGPMPARRPSWPDWFRPALAFPLALAPHARSQAEPHAPVAAPEPVRRDGKTPCTCQPWGWVRGNVRCRGGVEGQVAGYAPHSRPTKLGECDRPPRAVRTGRTGASSWRQPSSCVRFAANASAPGKGAPGPCMTERWIWRQDPMNREDDGRMRLFAKRHARAWQGPACRIWNEPHAPVSAGGRGSSCSGFDAGTRENPMHLLEAQKHADRTRTQHPCSSVFICGSIFLGIAHGMGGRPRALSAAAPSCRRKCGKTP